jgi:hypothetical protein
MLLKVKIIVDIYLKYKALGFNNRYIYKNYIYPIYFISEGTFYNYLTIPVNRLLKEFDANSKEPDIEPLKH